MTKVKCNLCEAEWDGADAYCPRCGLSLSRGSGSRRVWEIAAVILAVIILVWLKR